MYKQYLALNNIQCHKTQPKQTNQIKSRALAMTATIQFLTDFLSLLIWVSCTKD